VRKRIRYGTPNSRGNNTKGRGGLPRQKKKKKDPKKTKVRKGKNKLMVCREKNETTRGPTKRRRKAFETQERSKD